MTARGGGAGSLVAAFAALVVIVAGWFLFGRHKAPTAAPQQPSPSVTVAVPGRQTVDRAITATGSLAARRDMPVGVAGEGGEVRQVLVEPGQWVKAGQVLAIVDRSVQAQTAAGLAAQVAVAQSDRDIAQSELDRAQALVDRGFIAKADLQRKAATRDAAAARVKVAQATLGAAACVERPARHPRARRRPCADPRGRGWTGGWPGVGHAVPHRRRRRIGNARGHGGE